METITRARRETETSVRGEGSGLLRFTLWVALIDAFGFGALLLLAPGFAVETIAGLPAFAYFSLRWSGGMLIGIAVGLASMLRNPEGQKPLFTAIATGFLLAGVGKVWSGLAGEYGGATWWYVTVLVGTLGVSALLWFTRSRAKELLE